MSGVCAAGTKLPKHGPCPKCGVGPSTPCPEAHRIAREERDALEKELADAVKLLHDLLGLVPGSGEAAYAFVERHMLDPVGTLPTEGSR